MSDKESAMDDTLTPEQIEEGRRLFTNIALPLGTDMLLDWLSENFSALLTTAERAVVERDVLLLQLKHAEQAIYERDALRAEVERLRGALTVLVAPANGYDGIPPRKYFGDTDFELRYPDDLIIEVQLGALRKARASLNGGKTDG